MLEDDEELVEEDDDRPHYDGEYLNYYTPAIAEIPDSDNGQMAARIYYLWDPTDPLVMQMHIQVAVSSIVVTPEDFPLEDPDQLPECQVCHDSLGWGSMGVLVPCEEPGFDVQLVCLLCSDDDESQLEESVWVISVSLVKGACADPPADPTAAGAAAVRVWRYSAEEIQFSLFGGGKLMFLTLPTDNTILMLDAISQVSNREFPEQSTLEESYLEDGIAMLESMANNEKK